jgi:hypothetical protein
MVEQADSFVGRILETICLGLALNKFAVESRFEHRRIMASEFFMNKLFITLASVEGNEFSGFPRVAIISHLSLAGSQDDGERN